MEFDFFNEWERIGTVKVGRQLMEKIVKLESIENMDVIESKFPIGHADEECNVERYVLGKNKYTFARELSNILSDECYKIIKKDGEDESTTDTSDLLNNPQVLVKLLCLLLDSNATHFTLG